MKSYQLIVVALFLVGVLVVISGCEYDGPTSMYYQEQQQTAAPVISQLDPANEAGPGINYITVKGENFSAGEGRNKVYFDSDEAEIISSSANAITVRRPTITGDTMTVKVVSYDAIEIAEYRPYKIGTVYGAIGRFVEGNQLSAVTVDENENVYVTERIPRTVFKIDTNGERTLVGNTGRVVSDMKIGPDGNLLIIAGNRRLYGIDVETGVETEVIDVKKNVSYGDFDSHGMLYVGGRRTDLIAVDLANSNYEAKDLYSRDEILCIRVYEGYVYLIVELRDPDEENPELAIWRHEILDGAGTLSERELVLDWSQTGDYAESALYSLTFSATGLMYVATDNINPVMTYDMDTGTQDILYKGILPTYATKLVWGSGNSLYMILDGDQADLLRVDMGAPGAPYYR